ncbi:hypothetical protein EDD18DRAFT_1202474 [Armillaria luteobubalina]|uniref:Uncharacterized protein n=1 Tax=Armillaria luteobubalina TaxID=153913 RepID=A0AA39PDZ4_9AGAR|nr:hypothetical protein EDD18DRAFT_1202474 [Armillaria luteobubalina]
MVALSVRGRPDQTDDLLWRLPLPALLCLPSSMNIARCGFSRYSSQILEPKRTCLLYLLRGSETPSGIPYKHTTANSFHHSSAKHALSPKRPPSQPTAWCPPSIPLHHELRLGAFPVVLETSRAVSKDPGPRRLHAMLRSIHERAIYGRDCELCLGAAAAPCVARHRRRQSQECLMSGSWVPSFDTFLAYARIQASKKIHAVFRSINESTLRRYLGGPAKRYRCRLLRHALAE